MRKITISLISMLLIVNLAFAGGLVTNTNQSAAWARMLVRDASTSIDAVYFNPAGLTKLSDGIYISFSNQSIYQDQTLTNSFPFLNNSTFSGSVGAPIFPSLYAAYKTGKWAFSFGFNVIGGGGSAEFAKGVPMAEIPISDLTNSLSSLGVRGYSTDLYLKGSSVYYGAQIGASYEVSDNVSLFAGVRYVMARNSYVGHVKDTKVRLADGTSVRADDFMNGVGQQAEAGSGQAAAGAGSATSAGDGLGNWVDGGAGGYTFDQAVDGGAMTAEQRATFEGALLQFGFSQDQIDAMTLAQAQGAFYSTATYLTNYAAELHAQALSLFGGAKLMGDQDIDVSQSGNGFTPIIGANLSFMDDNLNFGIKYEFKTKMTLTNSTVAGKGFHVGLDANGQFVDMYPDGAETNADMPAMLSVGAKVNVSKTISLQGGFHTYWDSKTGWENVDTKIHQNFQEYALGAEFNVTKNLLLSTGYLYAKTGVNPSYQNDLGYSLTPNNVGAGGAYKLSDKLTFQFGGYYVSYNSVSIPGSYEAYGYTQKYEKSTWSVSFGLDFKLGK